jgi:prepilin-type N-terminal cleavage/methylation domain-containing protein
MAAYRKQMRWAPPTNPAPSHRPPAPSAFTLVEMLIAMAITLVMMAAVVTLFANVSNSVRNRRATIEMTSQVRHLRNVLQQDLQGATCPGLTWQRPESNHGYIELIEGIHSDQTPTSLSLDPGLSIVPRNNIGADADGNGKITNQELEAHYQKMESFVPGGLGDYDDILMLTVRNEHEPFVGRMPTNVRAGNNTDANGFADWTYDTVESTLAEVVWFAVENPPDDEDPTNFFGEPGMRTIYRRALLIAPWLNPYRKIDNGVIHDTFREDATPRDTFQARPGLLRVLPHIGGGGDAVHRAVADLIEFQDRYDISARLEWDHNIGDDGRWTIVANTLADLTKRENRYEHHFARPGTGPRDYPYAVVSWGSDYEGDEIEFVIDQEASAAPVPPEAKAILSSAGGIQDFVARYVMTKAQNLGYAARPFVHVEEDSRRLATARAILDDDGKVVRIIHGLVPFGGSRRGQDVMMTDVLGFDLRVYDPGAPLYMETKTQTVLQPGDPGWRIAYDLDVASASGTIDGGGDTSQFTYDFVGQGAYVNLGYGAAQKYIPNNFFATGVSGTIPWFFVPRALGDVYIDQRPVSEKVHSHLAPGYAVYDTWSFHYENNGVNEDERWFDGADWKSASQDPNQVWREVVDTGTDGLDNNGLLGPDDVSERETVPPYDKPLRGVQVLIRTYEPDSRAIRQVRVNQHFMPE